MADNHRICWLFIVYVSESNPFRRLIPLALSDPVLLDAILALAARHRANDEQSVVNGTPGSPVSTIDREALQFKYRALRGLSRSIRTQDSYQDATVASPVVTNGITTWKAQRP